RLQVGRGDSIVRAHRDGSTAPAADERAVGGPDEAKDVEIDIVSDAASHVIGAENMRIRHGLSPGSEDVGARCPLRVSRWFPRTDGSLWPPSSLGIMSKTPSA